jgi:hypothetical protein
MYSIVGICNSGVDVVCYSDNRGDALSKLYNLKDRFNLSNLIIKEYDFESNPWNEQVRQIRNNVPDLYKNPEHPYYSLCPEVYWLKFTLLDKELELDTNTFWIDAGLSTRGLFPDYACSYSTTPGWKEYFPNQDFKTVEHMLYYFDKAFTPEKAADINKFANGKIVNFVRRSTTNYITSEFTDHIGEDLSSYPNFDYHFPIAGFFGGDPILLKQYIEDFFEVLSRALDNNTNFLFFEEVIMWYIYTKDVTKEKFAIFYFDTFYHEDWGENYNPTQVPISRFFLEPLT